MRYKSNLCYADHWRYGGGAAATAGEGADHAIVREECGVALSTVGLHSLTQSAFDFGFDVDEFFSRSHYVVATRLSDALRLGVEGSRSALQALVEKRLVPCNDFAIRLHHQRQRLAGGALTPALAASGQLEGFSI